MSAVITNDLVLKISKEFQDNIKTIFGENLIFGFICGGFSKGYAQNLEHDIDMFICLKRKDSQQESKFKVFYFDIHKKYGLAPDYKDPGEVITLSQLKNAFNILENFKLNLIVKYYREYEAIVWADMLSGKIIGETGDLNLLKQIQSYCSKFPEKWRKEILEKINKNDLRDEWNSIKNMEITRLFRRYVTYLKKQDGDDKVLNVCILGGGGNVAEAVAARLLANGHKVSQFRFDKPIHIPGIPQRTSRSVERIKKISYVNVSKQEQDLKSEPIECITNKDELDKFDVFIFAFPSYMAEPVAERLGSKLIGKPLVNLSDRFLGTYALMIKMQEIYGKGALPSISVAFNGVPIMALKENRESPTSIYYIKPKHSIAWYPQTREGRTNSIKLLIDLFKFSENSLNLYPSMLHLAFENAHCVEHAVVDLYNLISQKYNSGNRLYSQDLYTKEHIEEIEKILLERNKISEIIVGRSFYSLKDYDARVFGSGGNPELNLAGTTSFRTNHASLSRAPSLLRTTAFGYEDVGWSMVTLESFATTFNVKVPHLSKLIDDWGKFMNCDYRVIGRTVKSLRLIDPNIPKSRKDYRELTWLPHFITQEAQKAIIHHSNHTVQANQANAADNIGKPGGDKKPENTLRPKAKL